jgi:hypothetical protein
LQDLFAGIVENLPCDPGRIVAGSICAVHADAAHQQEEEMKA